VFLELVSSDALDVKRSESKLKSEGRHTITLTHRLNTFTPYHKARLTLNAESIHSSMYLLLT